MHSNQVLFLPPTHLSIFCNQVERLRAAMVHKAQPVRHYKAVEVKPSDRPLTKPTSPSFSERITVKYQKGRKPQRS